MSKERVATKMQPLRAVFESLSDPLVGKRRSQPLGRTLTLVFLALISGENSERGMANWIEEQRWRLKSEFGFRRDDVPCRSSLRAALQAVDAAELETKLEGWSRAYQATDETWAGVAIDGKTLRGSADETQGALHMLNAFSQHLGIVLGQRLVGNKTNEIPEIIPLLEALTLTGQLVTVDALHTQVKTAQTIVEKGGPI